MHPELKSLTINLGTQSGPDLVSTEMFSSVFPRNNSKLRRDTKRVFAINAAHKYVFFLCPGFSGEQQKQFSAP